MFVSTDFPLTNKAKMCDIYSISFVLRRVVEDDNSTSVNETLENTIHPYLTILHQIFCEPIASCSKRLLWTHSFQLNISFSGFSRAW